jgi:hypothetical protein
MAEGTGPPETMTPQQHRDMFPYDDRPVQPKPSDVSPLDSLAGRGQTEGTPMGLGIGLSLAIVAAVALVFLASLAGYLVSLLR